MRILFVTDFYDPYTGGVEIHVKTVAEALVARGHEVGVATLPPGPNHPPRSEPAPAATADGPSGAVQVFPVEHLVARLGRGVADAARPWAPPFPDPVAVSDLRRVVRTFAPDVIHGHDWLARSVLPRVVSGSIPIITTLHYYTRTCAKKTMWRDGGICPGPGPIRCLRCAADHYGAARGTVVALGLRAGAALEDRRSGRYVSVSPATATGNGLPVDSTTGRGPRSVVVANPLAPDAIDGGDSDDGRPGRDGGVPSSVPDGPFIAFVGDLRPEKGIHVLLEAVGHLRRDDRTDLPLVLVGERTTPDLTLPEATIEVGPVDHAVVQAIWRRATVGVVPSLWPEPFGLVAIEAMAAGCPLVASEVGGLADILGPEDPTDPSTGRGVLVTPGDTTALADAIDGLVADPERRRSLADRARRSLDRYGLDHIVDGIEAEYRLAVGADTTDDRAPGRVG